jgi:hypothetical protein
LITDVWLGENVMTYPVAFQTGRDVAKLLLGGSPEQNEVRVWDVLGDQELPAADGGMARLDRTVDAGKIFPQEEVTVRSVLFRNLQVFGSDLSLHRSIQFELNAPERILARSGVAAHGWCCGLMKSM